ncbi:AAA family ATPase [Methanobrevibacter sp.]|uniref:AAA family ATPase n=1 Tax=Methanobrevibacter sp. TaxID=66852 RepID=UPI00388F2AA9
MRISNITFKNIKSFKEVNLDLDDFNVIIGSCASGKSNFIEVFKFLKDLSEDFEKTINNYSRFYLKNINSKNDENCYLKIIFTANDTGNYLIPIFKNDEEIFLNFNQLEYELSFNFKSNFEYEILKENVDFSYEYTYDNEIYKNKLSIKNTGKINVKLDKADEFIKAEDLVPSSLLNIVKHNFQKSQSLIINSSLSTIPFAWKDLFKNIEYYYFNPKFSKFGTHRNGDSNLLEFSDNLPIILEKILDNNNDKRLFLNLVNHLLPYIEEINVDTLIDGRTIFTLNEEYNEINVPSPLISDGTVNIIALIVALFFEKETILLIEEPERNIHPELLANLIQLMNEVSRKKQLIITTHNPELLKHVKLENIYFISRNKSGFPISPNRLIMKL